MKYIILLFMSLTILLSTAHASTWSDTYIGYRYGSDFREPENPDNISKNILSLTHISGYKYGSNFFNVDMLTSSDKDKASGGGGGAHEVYVVYRTTLSLNSLGVPVKFGFIRDLGITAGFDYGAKDDQFSSRVEKYAIGPKISFDVPGFFDTAVVFRTEKNHNWFATPSGFGSAGIINDGNPDVKFDNTFAIETAWGIPLNIFVPITFKGFANYIGSKGKDGMGNNTKPETLIEAALMADIGSLFGRKDTLFIGPGYQYWHNKFGNNAKMDNTGGSTANAFQIEFEFHF